MWVQCKSCDLVMDLKRALDHLKETGHTHYSAIPPTAILDEVGPALTQEQVDYLLSRARTLPSISS